MASERTRAGRILPQQPTVAIEGSDGHDRDQPATEYDYQQILAAREHAAHKLFEADLVTAP